MLQHLSGARPASRGLVTPVSRVPALSARRRSSTTSSSLLFRNPARSPSSSIRLPHNGSSAPLLRMRTASIAGKRFFSTAPNNEGDAPKTSASGAEGNAAQSSATTPQTSITIQNMEEYHKLVLEASKTKPIIVDCYADWCKPCKDLAPLLETVIKSREGKVTLVKVNIDKVGEVAVQLSVSSIPAVFAFSKKEVVGKFVGLKSKSELEDFVDGLLKNT